jgi:hypothetical protein
VQRDLSQRTHAIQVGPEHGLICGFELGPDGTSKSIGIDDVATSMAVRDRVVWLHFNASNAGARR